MNIQKEEHQNYEQVNSKYLHRPFSRTFFIIRTLYRSQRYIAKPSRTAGPMKRISPMEIWAIRCQISTPVSEPTMIGPSTGEGEEKVTSIDINVDYVLRATECSHCIGKLSGITYGAVRNR